MHLGVRGVWLREWHQGCLRQWSTPSQDCRDKEVLVHSSTQTSLYVHRVRQQNLHQAMAYRCANLD